MMKTIKVLSLGAGIQSSCLFLMACRDEIERPDHVVFADTQCEPQIVYDHLDWLKGQGEKYGLPVQVVSKGNLKTQIENNQVHLSGERYATIPLFTYPDGVLKKQCSREFKGDVIDSHIRKEIVGLRPKQHFPETIHIEHWFGITKDEATRIRYSNDKWRTNQYPFCNFPRCFLSHDWGRDDCKNWLEKNYPERHVPKSACYICPMRSDTGWRWMQKNDRQSFDKAVEFDAVIRVIPGLRSQAYLHKSRTPLSEVDFRTDVEKGQLTMFDMDCSGYCGT